MYSASVSGDEEGEWVYLQQVAYAVQEYSRTHPPVNPHANEKVSVYETAVSRTLWGVYNITVFVISHSYARMALTTTAREPYRFSRLLH